MTPIYQDFASNAFALMGQRVEIAAALDIAETIQRSKKARPEDIAQARAEVEAKIKEWARG